MPLFAYVISGPRVGESPTAWHDRGAILWRERQVAPPDLSNRSGPMRLTRFTDNALRRLIYLARHPGRTVRVSEVARGMAMSEDHLLKVVRRLNELGYVSTVRGRHGGVRLAMEPQAVVIADVIRATEESFALVPCFLPGPARCPITSWCVLPGALGEALEAFFHVLGRYTLSDLVRRERGAGLIVAEPAA